MKIKKIKIKNVKKNIIKELDYLIKICNDKDIKKLVKCEEIVYKVIEND